MKIVNPVGREPLKLDTSANYEGIMPFGCVCSSGKSDTMSGYNCSKCGCQCDQVNSSLNVDYNMAEAKDNRNYVG